MRKIIAFILILITIIGAHFTWSKIQEQQEIESYIFSVSALNDEYSRHLDSYEDGFVKETDTDKALSFLKDDLLKNFEEFYLSTLKLPLEHKELEKLNQHYLAALSIQLEIFNDYASSLEKGDVEIYKDGNQKSAEMNALFEKHYQELKALAKENNITILPNDSNSKE